MGPKFYLLNADGGVIKRGSAESVHGSLCVFSELEVDEGEPPRFSGVRVLHNLDLVDLGQGVSTSPASLCAVVIPCQTCQRFPRGPCRPCACLGQRHANCCRDWPHRHHHRRRRLPACSFAAPSCAGAGHFGSRQVPPQVVCEGNLLVIAPLLAAVG